MPGEKVGPDVHPEWFADKVDKQIGKYERIDRADPFAEFQSPDAACDAEAESGGGVGVVESSEAPG